MRGLALFLIGCGSSAAAPDAAPDMAPDAPGCQTEILLAGGMDLAAQGWQVAMDGPGTVSNGADYLRIEGTTTAGKGGSRMIYRPSTLPIGAPARLVIDMLVERTAAHNPADAPAAIMASFTPPFGTQAERNAMVYLEANRLGWSDDQQAQPAALVDGRYHTYEIVVSAAGAASVTVDGGAKLERSGFATNGTLAVGDQTNEANLDSALQIRSIQKLCP